MEREKIEREKHELLRLEREHQRMEREKLEREREELRRQQMRYVLDFIVIKWRQNNQSLVVVFYKYIHFLIYFGVEREH